MKKSKHDYFSYFFCLVSIFVTDSFIVFTNQHETIKVIFRFVLIAMFFLSVCKKGINLKKHMLLVWCGTLFPLLCSILLNVDFSGESIYRFIILLICPFLAQLVEFERYRKAYVNIMYLIGLISLILYPFSAFISNNSSLFPIVTNIGGTQVACFGLTNVYIGSQSLFRNPGPFWEPGVYAIYLNLALIFSLSRKPRINRKNLVLVLAIMSTVSTSGIGILVIVLFSYFYLQTNKISSKKMLMIVLAPIILIVSFWALEGSAWWIELTSKLDPTKYQSMSMVARLGSIFGNVKIWVSRPLFGVGVLEHDLKYVSYINSLNLIYPDYSNTNALLSNFARYGLGFGAIYLYWILRFAKQFHWIKQGKWLLSVAFILMLFSEPLTTSFIFNLIIFYIDSVSKTATRR